MKLSFSDKFVKSNSFLHLCNIVKDYGYEGVEVFDAKSELIEHNDSIFRPSITGDAKRKLINRHIAISVLNYPNAIESEKDGQEIVEYIELAALASVKAVIVKFDKIPQNKKLKDILLPAINVAEQNGVSLLIETSGPLAYTEKVLEIINFFGTAVLKVCWNIRETFFTAGESADKTSQTLGAYIGYVRLGDKKNDKNVIIGDGELPVKDFINALSSLNYDGYVGVMESDDVCDLDVVLTHFESYLTTNVETDQFKQVYYNRAKSVRKKLPSLFNSDFTLISL
jgi:fatty-acyl-CoA synthase